MDDYDVVLDALQKHRDKLWERIDRNMSSGYIALNLMDDIRFYQIEQLDEAIMARKNKTPQRKWVGLTAEERREIISDTERDDRGYVMALVEAKLKEKNG